MNYRSWSFIILALICGVLISSLYGLTREQIRSNSEDYANRQLLEVIGSTTAGLERIGANRYRILDDDGGLVFQLQSNEGYNGLISLWIAIDDSGNIRGVRVYNHQETPGIGDFIDRSVSDWIDRFVDSADKDHDHVSGATITSRAVINAVYQGLEESGQ